MHTRDHVCAAVFYLYALEHLGIERPAALAGAGWLLRHLARCGNGGLS